MSYYTDETRRANPYLREIDRTKVIIDADINDINNKLSIIESGGGNTEIVTNEVYKYNSHFSPNLIAYYDFSDKQCS